jgi:4-hydroxy-tetrahydrodipicolinate synthase
MLKLTGTIVPLVTPFSGDDESIDHRALADLVEFITRQGADGLMPTALTGEGPLLSPEEILEVWDGVFEVPAGTHPVIPAIVSTTTRTAQRLAAAAEKKGAAAVMAAPVLPELYAGRSVEDVVRFYQDLARATTLPIILFNYPSLTGVDFVPALVQRLADLPSVAYIKESTGDTRRVHGIQRLLGNRIEVICGAPNVALESLALGCQAWITGIMNDVPRSCRQLMQALRNGKDPALARSIYDNQVLPMVDVLAANSNPTGTIKAGVRARGVEVGIPRRPGHDVGPADWEAIAALMDRIAAAEERTKTLLEVRP